MSAQLNETAPDYEDAVRIAKKVRKHLGPENMQRCDLLARAAA